MADVPMINDSPPDPTKRIGNVARIVTPWRRRLILLGGGGAIFLLLIVIVVAVLLNVRGDKHAAAGVAQTFAAPRAGNSGKVTLIANAATVGVHPLDTGNPNLLQGSFTPGKDRGDALLQHKGETWMLQEENGSADSADSAAWDVGIAPGIALDLSMTLDATSSDVDLRALSLTSLKAEANASTLRLVLPASYTGDAKGQIKAAAGNVQVTVPPGAAVRFVIETKAGSRDVPARFVQKNGGYETPEYAAAKNRLTLTISANAGRVTIV
ncbi:MAG TPA: hypothetical protein VIG44_08265 [Thermomicrobiales bacterium]